MSKSPTCTQCGKPLKANFAIAGFSCPDCKLDWGFDQQIIDETKAAIPKSIDQLVEFCESRGIKGSVKVDIDLYKKLVDDSKILDFLDAKGGNWMSRHSSTGRGYRVHQDPKGTHASARAAIIDAIERGD